ncbi:MAG: hypothetical protein ABJ034_10075, partial [Hyphomicrobiales bacterium]
ATIVGGLCSIRTYQIYIPHRDVAGFQAFRKQFVTAASCIGGAANFDNLENSRGSARAFTAI